MSRHADKNLVFVARVRGDITLSKNEGVCCSDALFWFLVVEVCVGYYAGCFSKVYGFYWW